MSEGLLKLREKFPDNLVSVLPRPTKKDNPKGHCNECGGYHGLPAVHLDYVGHAALTDRLLDVDINWNWEPLAIDEQGLPRFDSNGGLWIKLTVCGQTRLGYGNAQPSEYKEIGSREKEVIGDALRNAAMRFGAALDLWHKGELHAQTEINEKITQTQGGTNAATGNTNTSTQGHQKTYGSGSVQREPNQVTNTNTKTQAAAPKGNSSRDLHNQGHGGQNNGETSFNELASYKVKIKGKHLDKSLSEVSNLEGYKDWWQQQIMDKKQVGPEVKEFIEQATLYLHAKEVKDKMKAAQQ